MSGTGISEPRQVRFRGLLLSGAALAILAMSVPAHAQTAPPSTDGQTDRSKSDSANDQPPPASDQDIIVTGTLIRGLSAPTGSNLLTVDAKSILATGSTTAIDVLNQTVPQLPTFNTLSVGGSDFGAPVTKIALRGFGNTAGNASGQTSTLLLLNGHRLVPVGILSTDPDPDLIPADVLDSVQVMPDGGSATYGSDAIGGVVNFVVRRKMDGITANYQHRFAANYNENNVSLTAGTSWNGGSALVSAVFANHDAILGKDRSYITSNFAPRGGTDYRSTGCPYGSFTVNGAVYTAPGFARVPSAPLCEISDYSSLVPKERRWNLFGYMEQQLSPSLRFSMDALYAVRDTWIYRDVASFPQTLTINASNPYFHPVAGETSQNVTFNFSRGLGNARITPQTFKQWQIDPSLTWSISDQWQLRGDFIEGKSFGIIHDRAGLNGDALSATTINPYDTSLTSPAVLANLADHEIYTRGVNELTSGQLVANGSLFTMPGGAVKLAIGGEYRRQSLDNSTVTGRIGDRSGLGEFVSSRTVKAAFAELFVPLVGNDNAMPFIHSLSLDAAIRYDKYSDFGGTTNPRVGIDYRPIEDIRLRANYQTTFVAPSLADSGNKIDTRLQLLTLFPGNYLIFIAGAGTNLKPQSSRNFSLGMDITPHTVSGLKFGVTYWNTRIDDIVSISLASSNAFTSKYNLCGSGFFTLPASPGGPCTLAFLTSLQPTFVRIDNGAAPNIRTLADLFAPGQNIIGVLDARRTNLGTEKISGLDFNLSYTAKVSWGSIFGQVAGTYLLTKKISNQRGGAFTDYLSGSAVSSTPRYNVVGTLGTTVGPVSGLVAVRRNGQVKLPASLVTGQTRISPFTVVDASFDLDLGSFGFAKNLLLSVTVQNVFDQDPPYSLAQPQSGQLPGFANGGTLGRAVNVGIRAHF